jgi:hypothetical protein
MTIRYLLVILLALVPCFWQKRIQAADLGSHVYNAWLVQLVAGGSTEGLTVVSQTTNILFDWLLDAALGLFGWSLGEKVAVAAAVALFVSGALAWIFAMAGKSCWWIAPSLLMLAYGWVFHMGFFNFYLGLGLAFWALALVWREDSPRRWAGAVLLLIAAQFAHTLPIAWAVAMLGFHKIGRRLEPRHLPLWTLAGFAGVLAVRYVLMTFRNGQWQFPIIPFIPADQAWVHGAKYYPALVALSIGWLFLVVRLVAKERCVSGSDEFRLGAVHHPAEPDSRAVDPSGGDPAAGFARTGGARTLAGGMAEPGGGGVLLIPLGGHGGAEPSGRPSRHDRPDAAQGRARHFPGGRPWHPHLRRDAPHRATVHRPRLPLREL